MRPFLPIFALAILLSILMAAIGCGGGSMSAQNNSAQPAITLAAQPSTVPSGTSTTLTWKASNATSVTISGLGSFPATGSVKATPTATTTYAATATGPGGTSATSTVVNVTTSGPKPTITLSAQPNAVLPGTPTVLNWTSSNTTLVTINGLGTFPPTGSVQVAPASTATYTANATGPGGTTPSSTTVIVSQNAPPVISLNAQPNDIAIGGTAVLSWTSVNATSVNIPGLGAFPPSGSTKVKPTSTTTYMVTCTGPGGTAQSSATVTVSPAPTISFNAQPNSIAKGGTAVLSWTTTNATSINIPGLGGFPANGSTNVTPTTTTTYTATATGVAGTANAQTTVTVQGGIPVFGHVILVMEENHSFSSVIGNSSMPYLNSLAQKYGLATSYFANTHPSIGNYFELTTGQIITNDDGYTGTVSADNVVRHLLAAGKTWKAYVEGLPSVGYIGGDVYPYAKHHNPFSYITDVVDSQNQLQNLVPFSEFAGDLNNNQLPQFSYIAPNMLDDGHDGSLYQADGWLQANIAPLIDSATFQKDGLLVIVFDESFTSDTSHGGGQVAMLVISPSAKKGYKSTILYQHQNTCRLLMEGLGLTSFPGACESAAEMNDFF
jgi:Phosphoesterase family